MVEYIKIKKKFFNAGFPSENVFILVFFMNDTSIVHRIQISLLKKIFQSE